MRQAAWVTARQLAETYADRAGTESVAKGRRGEKPLTLPRRPTWQHVAFSEDIGPQRKVSPEEGLPRGSRAHVVAEYRTRREEYIGQGKPAGTFTLVLRRW